MSYFHPKKEPLTRKLFAALSHSGISFKIGHVNDRNTIWGENPTFSSLAHPHSFRDALNGNVPRSVTIATLRSRYHPRLMTFARVCIAGVDAMINHNIEKRTLAKRSSAPDRKFTRNKVCRALRGYTNKYFYLMNNYINNYCSIIFIFCFIDSRKKKMRQNGII